MKLERDMGRKFIYILTVLLFTLSTSSFGYGYKKLFLWNGGTTKDGIVISKPDLSGFLVNGNKTGINVVTETKAATMIFDVVVPNGKVAELEYKVFLQLVTKEKILTGSRKITITTQLDGKSAKYHQGTNKIEFNSEILRIPSGKHTITINAEYKADKCSMWGGIKAMYIHVHDFSEPRLIREPICGQRGVNNSKCTVCGLDSTIYLPPKHTTHSLKESSSTATSCLSNMGKIHVCEYCPYSEIERKDSIKSHTFDAEDKCTVCGMHKPKSNANHSVYEVYDASELRVLAEMISIGTVPGNIGIDIKNDLVFSNTVTLLPLGSFEHPFQGVINGNGHRIRGIVNCFQGIDCLGLVGVAKGTILEHAVIANLIYDAGNTMKGTACVGGIVGYAAYCDIVNCASFGVLEGQNYVGGIVGYADQHVTFNNCASVSPLRTGGHWNPMACGLPNGKILNSYGAATNSLGENPDELNTTTFRHCFTTHSGGVGLKQVSRDMLSTYNMLEMLNEESDTPSFMMSNLDPYPIPAVNTAVKAMPNPDIPTVWTAIPRRVRLSDLTDDGAMPLSPKERETEIIGGYVDDEALANIGTSVEEILKKDSVDYPDFIRTYVVTRSVSEGELDLFAPMTGGKTLGFESHMIAPDSSYTKLTEYQITSTGNVKAVTETIDDKSGPEEYIDEYEVMDGERNLVSHTIISPDEREVTYQENIDGSLQTMWNIQTIYNEDDEPIAAEVYTHNTTTGETQLEYAYDFTTTSSTPSEDYYSEYVDEATNTIHVLENNLDSITGKVISRLHIIINGEDLNIKQVLSEKMIDDQPYLTDGMYFVYDEVGDLLQVVVYGPEDENHPGENLRPFQYFDFVGLWEPTPYPTAIRIPTAEKPSLQKQTDYNIYDMQGRVVRRVTNLQDPFSGLPNGLYIYQGSKYFKRS